MFLLCKRARSRHVSVLFVPQVSRFLGVPYAQAPVGELRFRPAQTHVRWSQTRDATSTLCACVGRGVRAYVVESACRRQTRKATSTYCACVLRGMRVQVGVLASA